MTITPLVVDQAPIASRPAPADSNAFAKALDGVGTTLTRADNAEDAFAAHTGTLQDAIFERAQADVTLSVATAAAQRTVQALQSVLTMQI
ncbi:MAG: flagellar hook-basal body complex protein FliE [Candidatus Baltobacteraceae bacterium]